MKIFPAAFAALSAALMCSCGAVRENAFATDESKLWSIGQELSFLSKYSIDARILRNDDAIVLYSPHYQGRVLTSGCGDEKASSLGWYNREVMALKNKNPRTEYLGGEDSFVVGPEGGDASIYFDQGAIFSEENRKMPEIMSTLPWKLVGASKTRARFEAVSEFTNAKGASFSVKAEREISLLSRDDVSKILGVEIPANLKVAAFQSMNKITNTSEADWSEKHGMLNIGVVGAFNANKTVNTFIPYRPGDASALGDIVRDNVFDSSFGTSNTGRVFVSDDYVRFKCDGRHISGVGISARRSEGIVVSYDDKNSLLTIVLYIRPSGARAYLPMSWRDTSNSLDGDAISVFNNGPVSKNIYFSNLFYSIQTNSPALSLAAGRSQFHLQRTFHFIGSEYDLDLLSYKLTGISLKQMRNK